MRCVFCCFFSFSLSRFRCLSSSLWFPLALVWQPWHVLFCLLFELLWALCFYLHLSLALPFFLALFLLWFAVALLLYLLLSCTNCMCMTVRCETKRAYALIPLLHHSPIAFKLANHCQPLFWAWAPKIEMRLSQHWSGSGYQPAIFTCILVWHHHRRLRHHHRAADYWFVYFNASDHFGIPEWSVQFTFRLTSIRMLFTNTAAPHHCWLHFKCPNLFLLFWLPFIYLHGPMTNEENSSLSSSVLREWMLTILAASRYVAKWLIYSKWKVLLNISMNLTANHFTQDFPKLFCFGYLFYFRSFVRWNFFLYRSFSISIEKCCSTFGVFAIMGFTLLECTKVAKLVRWLKMNSTIISREFNQSWKMSAYEYRYDGSGMASACSRL